MRFWEASALVPLCRQETGSTVVRSLHHEDEEIAVWWGSRLECISALMRLVREGRLDAYQEVQVRACLADLFEAAAEVEPTEDVRDRAERLLALHPLRAADALQLAAALVWARERPIGRGFVCLDQRLRQAAGREGFGVLPPIVT